MLVGGVNGAWANDVTFNYTVSRETAKDGIEITGGSYSSGGYYGISSGNSFTITSEVGNITAITLNYVNSDANRVGGTVTASTGSYTLSSSTGTWTGSAAEVTFSTTNSARITSFTVTYAASSLTAVYNYTWGFSSLTSGTDYVTSGNIVNNLEINAVSSSENIKVDTSAGTKTFDGVGYSQYLWMSGSGSGGNNTSRNLHFKVTGNCTIKVYFYNYSSDQARSIGLSNGSTEVATQEAATSSQATLTYSYTGGVDADMYVYSKNSGLNVYGIKVTPTNSTTTTINIADLCYEHYYFGSDLNRNVAGFDLTAEGNIVSQTNNSTTPKTYYLLYRAGATVRIQPNSSNSAARITKVKYTGSGFTAALGSSSDTEYTAYDGDGVEYIEFTNNTGNNMNINSVEITTDRALTWSKITPSFAFSPSTGEYTAGSGEQNLGNLNTGTLRTTYPTAFRLDYTIEDASPSGVATCSYRMSMHYLQITPKEAGSGKMRAAFTDSSNPYYNTTSQDYSFTVNPAIDTYTSSYTANNSATEIDGKIRPLSGTFAFTGAGTFTSGTPIKDVPGISVTFTKGSSELNVVSVSTSDRYIGTVLMSSSNTDHGSTISFTPYVNGYLSIQGNFYIGTSITGNNSTTIMESLSSAAYYKEMHEFATPLKAGVTYTLSGGSSYSWELHGYQFRPAFLVDDGNGNPSDTEASKDSSNPETANSSTATNKFPHLITSAAGEGKVKFADAPLTSGIEHLVNLYTNGNVVLLENGETLVKGTVLLDGSENELFTYYYLQSNILKLESVTRQANTGTSESPEYGTATAISDQDYIAKSDLENGRLVFHFNNAIKRLKVDNEVKEKIYFRILGGNASGAYSDWTDITSGFTNVDESNQNLYVKFGELEAGKTYQVNIKEGALRHSNDANVQNTEIFFTFTVEDASQAQIKLIYPTGLASVGTSIVLETYLNGSTSNVIVDKDYPVTGVLTALDGGYVDEGGTTSSMSITASYSQNRLVFKPTKTLRSNTTYYLTVDPTQVYIDNDSYPITTKKVFMFTTGAAAGTEPDVTTTSPIENVTVTARSGNIYFTFDQEISIEPYSEVFATPINGSEATANGIMAMEESDEATTLKHVDGDSKTIYFPYAADGLKYDLYYEVLIPANTVVGVGGKPNSNPITLHFRMGMNPSATAVTASSFYPHTWDFNKFGDQSVSTSTAYHIKNGNGDPGSGYRLNSLYSTTEDGYTTYKTKNQSGYGFDQGADVYLNYKDGSNAVTEVMDEFAGMRISLVDTRSNRFEIRNITSNGGSTNADGTDKWVLRLNGNTHYVTLSNVPAGKLYMVMSTVHLGINSPNATIESVSLNENQYTLTKGKGSSKDNTLLNTHNRTSKVVINVETAGDVTFCVQNFNCEKIGVSTEDRNFYGTFSIDDLTYATDCRSYPVRYDLVNAFTDDVVKGYYINSIEENVASPYEVETAYAEAGTIVILQSGVSSGSTRSIPIFKTDVNTPGSTKTNYLHGTVSEINNFENTSGTKYFFSNLYKQLNKEKTAFADADARFIQANQMGFYRAIGNYVSANKAWLDTSSHNGWDARLYVMFGLFDVERDPVAVNTISNEEIEDGKWYTIQGVRVAHPEKGNLYIHNGKKVVIK